jgi:MerR family mercuric resistance operon transcriptional regulator
MQISEAARRAGISPPTIRYYEEIGLLPKPSRSGAGYRRYTDAAVEELRFIRKAQAIGFSLEEIRQILQLSRAGQQPCGHVLALAHQHLAAVDERIRRLQKFRKQLAADLAKWDGQKTATTCSGLCKWIADSDLTAEDVSVRRTGRG